MARQTKADLLAQLAGRTKELEGTQAVLAKKTAELASMKRTLIHYVARFEEQKLRLEEVQTAITNDRWAPKMWHDLAEKWVAENCRLW